MKGIIRSVRYKENGLLDPQRICTVRHCVEEPIGYIVIGMNNGREMQLKRCEKHFKDKSNDRQRP